MYILNIILIISMFLWRALEIATRVVPGVNGKCLNMCDLHEEVGKNVTCRLFSFITLLLNSITTWKTIVSLLLHSLFYSSCRASAGTICMTR